MITFFYQIDILEVGIVAEGLVMSKFALGGQYAP